MEYADFRRAEIVLVARCTEHIEAVPRYCEPLGETIWIQRERLRPILTVKGQTLNGEFVASYPSDKKSIASQYKLNRVYLIGLYPKDSKGTLPNNGVPGWRYLSETENQLAVADYYSVPDLGYTLAGESVLDKCSFIFAQGYAATKDLELLTNVQQFADRKRVEFYTNTVEPVLLRTAGDSDLMKSQVYSVSVEVGVREKREPLRGLIEKLDRETEDTDAINWIPLDSFRNEPEYLIRMLRARLTVIRAGAIILLEVKPERRDLIVSMLGDSKKLVRYHAIKWLHQLHEEGAPQPKWGANETVENEAEVIAYWRGR